MEIYRNRINKYIIIYYAILLLIMAIRTSMSAPNAIIRLVYLLAFFIPIVFKYTKLYLPCVVIFMTVCTYNFAFGYLPYDISAYFYITLVSWIITTATNTKKLANISTLFFVVLYYVGSINILYGGSLSHAFYGMAAVAIGMLITGNDIRFNRFAMLNCFSIISLVLSAIYLYNYESFLETYSQVDGQERSGWNDPNYFSCVIGAGVVTSLILLLKERNSTIFIKIFWIITIVVSFVAQALLASRGGVLSVGVTALILIIFSNIGKFYKVILVLLISIFIIVLYTNDYFELLLYRIENDTSGGSGRIDIWNLKISTFISDGNVFSWLFGVGHDQAVKLGTSSGAIGFHNDYLAILCGYGIVGLLTFVYLLFVRPFRYIYNDRTTVLALVIYLAVTCFTLEPISSGRITFIGFYALILICSKVKE